MCPSPAQPAPITTARNVIIVSLLLTTIYKLEVVKLAFLWSTVLPHQHRAGEVRKASPFFAKSVHTLLTSTLLLY